MAESEKNARRSDEAERSRHISATESVAFATMLLGLLNDSDTVLHRLEHEGEARAAERAAVHALPADMAAAPAPADAGPSHQDQHAGMVDVAAADPSPTIHADATATVPLQDASVAIDDTPSASVVTTEAFSSSPMLSGDGASIYHAPSAGTGSAAGSVHSTSLDLGASVHTATDTITGIVDTALATVSNTIASVGATVTQLTSTVTDMVSHLVDGLLGTSAGTAHDAPSTGLLEPLAAGLLGPEAPSSVDTTSHGASLLDTAGAIPMSLLHPMPLQLGFLGQPTMDGHEPHDGAFSALGVHHF